MSYPVFSVYPGSDPASAPSQFSAAATVTTAGPVTLTVAQVLNAIYNRDTNAAARTDTTPTARAIINAIPGGRVGSGFLFAVRNVGTTHAAVTIAGGTGVTITGTATVAKNGFTIFHGVVTQVNPTPAITLYADAYNAGQQVMTAITADGAVDPHTQAQYAITKAGVAVLTLAAPTATTDDGLILHIDSSTANAHTLTATGLLQTGSANVNVATFAASAGASLRLRAFNGKWIAESQIGITFS